MYFNRDNPESKNYRVFLDGEMVKNAIEADDQQGWVRVEQKSSIPFFNNKPTYKTFYGKIHIVRFEGYDE